MTKDKSLKEKSVKIQGKSYVLVSDRIIYFNEVYPQGAIKTEQLESTDRVEFKATVIPDVTMPDRYFTGHSQAVWGQGMVNKTSALENAETSAVGRALAMMGIGVINSIASVDEINKAKEPQIGVCATCGAEMKLSKQGHLYCPNTYSKDPANPHNAKKQLPSNMEAFNKSLS